MDTCPQFGEIERFADEILGAGFESAQFVSRLRRDHDHRKIAALFDFLQSFHHLEAIHAGHLEIEQDQRIVILPVKFAHGFRIGGRFHGSVAGHAQHSLQQTNVYGQIVNHQDSGIQYVGRAQHVLAGLSMNYRLNSFGVRDSSRANSITASSVCMNSFTLIGLVR